MSKGDVAILMSLISLVLAAVSVSWNIYREVALRPRVRVVVDRLVEVPLDSDGTVLSTPTGKLMLSAINFGPGEIRCELVIARFGSMWETRVRRSSSSLTVIARLEKKKLAVGDRVQFTAFLEKAWYLGQPNVRIGVVDSFGREHWASQKQVRRRVSEHGRAIAHRDEA